jgi:C1A family cysteine protease
MGRAIARYGWRPDLPDARDYRKPLVANANALPPRVDLRPLMPPVYDQGAAGSCVGNAVAAAVQFTRRRANATPDFTPSRLYIYYNARLLEGATGFDGGAQIRDGVKGVVRYGAPPEDAWVYDTDQVLATPPQDAYDAGKLDLLLGYQRVNQSVDDLRHALASHQPFVFGFSVYESFEGPQVAGAGQLNLPAAGEALVGGHAVLAAGYDDASRVFLVRNSWGADWGMQGYFTIPFEYLSNVDLASDFWVLEQMSN